MGIRPFCFSQRSSYLCFSVRIEVTGCLPWFNRSAAYLIRVCILDDPLWTLFGEPIFQFHATVTGAVVHLEKTYMKPCTKNRDPCLVSIQTRKKLARDSIATSYPSKVGVSPIRAKEIEGEGRYRVTPLCASSAGSNVSGPDCFGTWRNIAWIGRHALVGR